MVSAVEEDLGDMLDQLLMGMRGEGNSVIVHEKHRGEKVILIEGSNHLCGLDSTEVVEIVLGNLLRKVNIVHQDIVDRKEEVREVTSVGKLPILVDRYGHLLDCHFEGYMTDGMQWTEHVG